MAELLLLLLSLLQPVGFDGEPPVPTFVAGDFAAPAEADADVEVTSEPEPEPEPEPDALLMPVPPEVEPVQVDPVQVDPVQPPVVPAWGSPAPAPFPATPTTGVTGAGPPSTRSPVPGRFPGRIRTGVRGAGMFGGTENCGPLG